MAVWRDILASVGELEGFSDHQARTPDGGVLPAGQPVTGPVVLRVLLHHEAGTMAAHLSLNRRAKLDGLYFGPLDAESDFPF